MSLPPGKKEPLDALPKTQCPTIDWDRRVIRWFVKDGSGEVFEIALDDFFQTFGQDEWLSAVWAKGQVVTVDQELKKSKGAKA